MESNNQPISRRDFFKGALGELIKGVSSASRELSSESTHQLSRVYPLIKKLEPMNLKGEPFGGKVSAMELLTKPKFDGTRTSLLVLAHQDEPVGISVLEVSVNVKTNRLETLNQSPFTKRYSELGPVKSLVNTPWDTLICLADKLIELDPWNGVVLDIETPLSSTELGAISDLGALYVLPGSPAQLWVKTEGGDVYHFISDLIYTPRAIRENKQSFRKGTWEKVGQAHFQAVHPKSTVIFSSKEHKISISYQCDAESHAHGLVCS